jgi:tetratricopeptide (TPR) repeat protein
MVDMSPSLAAAPATEITHNFAPLSHLVLYLFIGGLLGGVGRALYEMTHSRICQPKSLLDAVVILFAAGVTGIITAGTLIFLGVWTDKIPINNDVKSQLTFLCFALFGGAVYRSMPKITQNALKRIENMAKEATELAEKAQVSAEEVRKSSEELRTQATAYSRGMSMAEMALARKRPEELSDAAEKLENLRAANPLDRVLHIYEGRLLRTIGDVLVNSNLTEALDSYDKAIKVLRSFLANLDSNRRTYDTAKFNEDCGAAWYNIACYHVVKAEALKERASMGGKIDELLNEAVEFLTCSIQLHKNNAKFARDDRDFNFLKEKRPLDWDKIIITETLSTCTVKSES